MNLINNAYTYLYFSIILEKSKFNCFSFSYKILMPQFGSRTENMSILNTAASAMNLQYIYQLEVVMNF